MKQPFGPMELHMYGSYKGIVTPLACGCATKLVSIVLELSYAMVSA